jgi:hypothetical protein
MRLAAQAVMLALIAAISALAIQRARGSYAVRDS